MGKKQQNQGGNVEGERIRLHFKVSFRKVTDSFAHKCPTNSVIVGKHPPKSIHLHCDE